MKTLVFGSGNELHGDDGVDIHVVRRLRHELETVKKTSQSLSENPALYKLNILSIIFLMGQGIFQSKF